MARQSACEGFPKARISEKNAVNSQSTERYLAIKVVMMPRDTNPVGTIFGGVLLSYIDQAGAVGAHEHVRQHSWPKRTLVTVALNAVEFHEPVFVGDVVSFWTRITRVGTTSIAVQVEVETVRAGQTIRLTQAEAVFVAVNSERRPVPIQLGERGA